MDRSATESSPMICGLWFASQQGIQHYDPGSDPNDVRGPYVLLLGTPFRSHSWNIEDKH